MDMGFDTATIGRARVAAGRSYGAYWIPGVLENGHDGSTGSSFLRIESVQPTGRTPPGKLPWWSCETEMLCKERGSQNVCCSGETRKRGVPSSDRQTTLRGPVQAALYVFSPTAIL